MYSVIWRWYKVHIDVEYMLTRVIWYVPYVIDARSPLCTVPCLPPSTTINVPQDWQCSWLVQRSISFFFFLSRFSLGNRPVAFFSLPFLLFMILRPADVVFSVAHLVSAFSFGVYTPLEVISDISLTTPYNVLNCILRVLRTTDVCEDIVQRFTVCFL